MQRRQVQTPRGSKGDKTQDVSVPTVLPTFGGLQEERPRRRRQAQTPRGSQSVEDEEQGAEDEKQEAETPLSLAKTTLIIGSAEVQRRS